jgi:hypothetical protein
LWPLEDKHLQQAQAATFRDGPSVPPRVSRAPTIYCI